jgi:DNA invertase Pin-like site-specific DNA recombinase
VTAYAYLRKSHMPDRAHDLSPETQEREVRALARRHRDNGRSLVILADWDVSGRGKYTAKRPQYQVLKDAIASGRCAALYSYSLSRLGRSVHELSGLFDLCADRNVPIRLVADAVDTSTASGMLLANVLSSVAQFEADVASERVRAAIATKRAKGEPVTGGRLYGTGQGDDAAAVLAAFDEAGSYSGAAKLLNDRGVRPRNSRRGWWPSSVAVVVDRLQGRARRPAKGVRAGGTDFALARLLRCPTCGTALTGTRDRGGRRVRYSCRLGTSLPHPRISVTEHLILPAIQAEADRLRVPRRVGMGGRDDAKRHDLEQRRTRILDMYEAGHIDRADRDRRLASVADLQAQLDARRVVIDVPKLDWSWPPRQVNNVLRSLFDHIDLDPATFQPLPDGYAWRLPSEYIGPAH